MNNPALQIPIEFPDFPVERIRFKAGSFGLSLPDYAGGVLRGGFGLALRRVSQAAWNDLFGNDREDSLFVPYMLVPPIAVAPADSHKYGAGDTFEFELRLFGTAIAHHAACIQALELLGKLGLGRERGRFALLGASHIRPEEPEPFKLAAPTWMTPNQLHVSGMASDWLRPCSTPVESVQINLETPLRLKHEGHLLGQAPDFSVLWRRLYARIALAAGSPVIETRQRQTMNEIAASIRCLSTQVHWQDWTRYSARQKSEMLFGGLLGTLQYRGDLSPFLPWLSLGSVLGLGGKTTFGLGCYRMQSLENPQVEDMS